MIATRRRAKVKVIDKGELRGSGATTTEAKADLNRQIDIALDGSYDPAIVTFGDCSIVVYRTPSGWEYQLFYADRPLAPIGVNSVSANCMLGNVTRDEAIQSAASHAIGAFGPMDYHADEEIPSFLTDRQKRADILGNCRFQRAYAHARDFMPGLENAWHEWACHHSRDPQFA